MQWGLRIPWITAGRSGSLHGAHWVEGIEPSHGQKILRVPLSYPIRSIGKEIQLRTANPSAGYVQQFTINSEPLSGCTNVFWDKPTMMEHRETLYHKISIGPRHRGL